MASRGHCAGDKFMDVELRATQIASHVRRGIQEIRILGPDFKIFKKVMYVCGLVGIDQFLLKWDTLTLSEMMHPFHTMKLSVAAVVNVKMEPKNTTDMPKLVEGLKRMAQSDPLVHCSTSKSGQHIIAGAGELHLEICLKDLRDDYIKGAEVRVSEPIGSFEETISAKSGHDEHPKIIVSKSPIMCYLFDISRNFLSLRKTDHVQQLHAIRVARSE